MGLDIRIPIGLMFTIFGVLLVGHGLASDKAIYDQHSLGININLYWGVALLVFGVVMLLLGRRGSSAMRPAEASKEGKRIEQSEHRRGLEDDSRRGGH